MSEILLKMPSYEESIMASDIHSQSPVILEQADNILMGKTLGENILEVLKKLKATTRYRAIYPSSVIKILVDLQIGTIPDGTEYISDSPFGKLVYEEFAKLNSLKLVVSGFENLTNDDEKWYICLKSPSERRYFGRMVGNMWSEYDENDRFIP